MRWYEERPPKVGTLRIVKKFALLPITINYEWRWLETVYILQSYGYLWFDEKFVTQQEYEEYVARKIPHAKETL